LALPYADGEKAEIVAKATITVVMMAALQLLILERALRVNRHFTDVKIVISDTNSGQFQFSPQTAVVIELAADIKEIFVADSEIAKVVPRTIRRVYITGVAIGKSDVFFYDERGREIAALEISVSEITLPQRSQLL
jgi:Flp pilus assembly secretin CpaC